MKNSKNEENYGPNGKRSFGGSNTYQNEDEKLVVLVVVVLVVYRPYFLLVQQPWKALTALY